MKTPLTAAERLLLIQDLKLEIKSLQTQVDEQVELLSADIDLGLLSEYEDGDSIIYEGVRCTSVTTSRWTYNNETKQAVKALQKAAQDSGSATEKTTVSYRFTSTV